MREKYESLALVQLKELAKVIDRIEMTETIGQTVPSVRIVQNALTVPKPVQRWSA